MSVTVGAKQKKPRGGKRFQPGVSGNTSGRKPGTKNHSPIAVEQLLEGEAEALGRKAIEMALSGDGLAVRLCLERVAPLRRGRPVQFTMPMLNTGGDLVQGLGVVLQAVATGELTPDEGSTVASILNAKRLAIETVTIEARLAELEKAVARGPTR